MDKLIWEMIRRMAARIVALEEELEQSRAAGEYWMRLADDRKREG